MQLYTDPNGIQRSTAGKVCIEADTGEPAFPVIWDNDAEIALAAQEEREPVLFEITLAGGYSVVEGELEWSQAAFDANEALKISIAEDEADAFRLVLRAMFAAAVDGSTPEGFMSRTIALTVLDETNRLREWITDFKAAVAGAASLAALKTAVAALGNLPEVSAATMKNELKDKGNSGLAD